MMGSQGEAGPPVGVPEAAPASRKRRRRRARRILWCQYLERQKHDRSCKYDREPPADEIARVDPVAEVSFLGTSRRWP